MNRFAALLLLAALTACVRPHPRFDQTSVVTPTTEHDSTAPAPIARPIPIDEPPPRILDPPHDPPPAPKDPTTTVEVLQQSLADAYFPYNRADLTPEGLAALRHDAELLNGALRDFPNVVIVVEGHCDDRGSAEYNLGLGDRRARRAAEILREGGVPSASLQIVSYGRENPQCLELTETCRQKNRRAHLIVTAPPAQSPDSGESPAARTAPQGRHRLW